jgi:hypothetical protein
MARNQSQAPGDPRAVPRGRSGRRQECLSVRHGMLPQRVSLLVPLVILEALMAGDAVLTEPGHHPRRSRPSPLSSSN